MSADEPAGAGLVGLARHLLEVRALATVLERHLGADDQMAARVRQMHATGLEAFNTLCGGLCDMGVLDGVDGPPPAAGAPPGATLQ
jgi:hypothetical protein